MTSNDGVLEHSRGVLFASQVSETPPGELYAHLNDAVVGVSLEPDLPGAVPTARFLLQTLRRLPVKLRLDPNGLSAPLIADLVAAVNSIDPSRSVAVSNVGTTTCAVHVGVERRGKAIRAVPEGHGGHLVVDPDIELSPTRPPSGLGVVFTASLATTELFKDAAVVQERRVRRLPITSFCPVSLSSDLEAAPDLPTETTVQLALLGVGAVGTAVVSILSQLPISGAILLADRQTFARENIGTYSQGGVQDIGRSKIELAVEHLDNWDIHSHFGDVDELPRLIDEGTFPWPDVVINALDSSEARHSGQRLWSSRLIDVGTSYAVVGLRDLIPEGPCLQCVLPLRKSGSSSLEQLAEITGLDVGYIAVDAPLELEAILNLPPEQRSRLEPLVGTPRCGLASAFGWSSLDSGGYQPSIPFVAQQAACLAIGRLVAHLTAVSTVQTEVLYDTLLGPGQLHVEALRSNPDCYCQVHAQRIEAIRRSRGMEQ
jgi:hypothetical protein